MNDENNPVDRRKSQRIPVNMWVQESKERELYFQRAVNLSRDGMFLERTIPHPIGTEVLLEFTLPGQAESMKVKARIVNTPDNEAGLGMGLEFTDLDERERAAIEAYIERAVD